MLNRPARQRGFSSSTIIPILRRGSTALIESEPGLAVHGAVGTRVAALEAMRESQPDLVIVDLALGDEDGLDLVKEIKTRYPKVPSLVLSMHDEAVMRNAR